MFKYLLFAVAPGAIAFAAVKPVVNCKVHPAGIFNAVTLIPNSAATSVVKSVHVVFDFFASSAAASSDDEI